MGLGIYHPRNPRATPLHALLSSVYETVKTVWEERFEPSYGFWRGLTDTAVARYLDCGLLENGFARVKCESCPAEYLLAFSCKGRLLCPSCGAKRAAAFAMLLRERILQDVGHLHYVFTIPKMLRLYFLHDRKLLLPLCQAAWETVRQLMAEAVPQDKSFRPGMVSVVQTFGDELSFHPHVHALVSRGGWSKSSEWIPVPYVSSHPAELLFRHKVLKFLKAADLLSEERIALLLSWRHTGFSVHNAVGVEPEDAAGAERLARYLIRPPVSLERLQWSEQTGQLRYADKAGHEEKEREPVPKRPLDALEFAARVLVHIPDRRRHLVHYYGAYSNAARARRTRIHQKLEAGSAVTKTPATAAVSSPACSPSALELRRTWAQLIRRIYQVDPLVCTRCGGAMRIVSFITERPVILKILRHLATAPGARAPP